MCSIVYIIAICATLLKVRAILNSAAQWRSQRGGQWAKLSYDPPIRGIQDFFFSNIHNILSIFENKKSYIPRIGGPYDSLAP